MLTNWLGKSDSSAFSKRGAQLDGAGRGVDLVVDGLQRAGGQLERVGAIPSFDGEAAVGAQGLEHRRQVGFGHGEDHRDRPHLRDDDEAVRIAAADQVAGIDLAKSEAAVDRRDDLRVGQVEAGARDLRLGRLDGAVQLSDLRFLADHLLRRDQLFLLQLLVALEIGLGVAQPGLVLFERALRLRQLHLIGPRVDLGQHLALGDALALGEVHLDQLAVEARYAP